MEKLRARFKDKRLFLDLTQSGLSKRSGVSLGSLKRFESSGHISLESLLKLSLVLECLDDFGDIANYRKKTANSLDEIMHSKEKSVKKRGSLR